MHIDYSLYLVTGRELLPAGKDYLESLEQSLQGGVTVVQIREKNTDTAEFLAIARDSKAICKRYNVPILINDRVDIALAMQADGVHLGQTDMPVSIAKKLLPEGSIIGVSCNTVKDVIRAVEDGADYVGIGSIWKTNTKKLTNPVVGVRAVGPLLAALGSTDVKAVAIGGIHSTNLLRTLHGAFSEPARFLDGIAVVSDIVASVDPKQSAENLKAIINDFRKRNTFAGPMLDEEKLLDGVADLMVKIRQLNPLVHQITNNVVATQSANITLALGASPIMATAPQEMEDLAKICSALLVNIGTLTEATVAGINIAGSAANAHRRPIVFDPVGVGASSFRQNVVNDLLNSWQVSVIKGNAGELAALAGSIEVASKGVDSVGSGFKDPIAFVKSLARRERCVVVLTGERDYISDGNTVVELCNGTSVLGQITGSGCILGSIIASFCGAAAQTDTTKSLVSKDILLASVTAVLVLTVASEVAVFSGPGTFLPGLIDSLHNLTEQAIRDRANIIVHV